YTLTLDGAVVTASGNSTAPQSGTLTTSNPNDLLIVSPAWNLQQNNWGGGGPTGGFSNEVGIAGAGSGGNGPAGSDFGDLAATYTGPYTSGGSLGSAVKDRKST